MKLIIKTNNSDQAYGASVVRAACQEPLRQMALNAGMSPDIVVAEVEKTTQGSDIGWDFRLRERTELLSKGIIDPVKVARTALQNAASCAGTLITTNYAIIQTEDE